MNTKSLTTNYLNKMEKWILCIGTGQSQLPLINAAKKFNFKILGIDQSPNFNIVDEGITISTYNSKEVVNNLKKFHKSKTFDAVIARVSGPAIYTAACCSEYLNLPGYSMKLCELSISKSKLRKYCNEHQIPTIEGKSYETIPKWKNGSDLIIKPDEPIKGKENVYRIKSASFFEYAFNKASEESLNNKVECQKYLRGRDIGIVIASSKGKLLWYEFYEEFVDDTHKQIRGKGHQIDVFNLSEKSMKEMIVSSLKILEHQNSTGFFFFSFRYEEGCTPLLYEFNPGLCGDNIANKIFPEKWPNFNFFEIDINLMRGEIPFFPKKKN